MQCAWIIPKPSSTSHPMKKLSSKKLVPGAKMVGDCCSRWHSAFLVFKYYLKINDSHMCLTSDHLTHEPNSLLDIPTWQGNQPWIFIERTDAEAPILWPVDAKSRLIGKDPDAEKDWRQEEKAMAEDEMVGWHHQLNGHEFEQAPGEAEGQGSLACCSLWGHKESDMTEWLNNLTSS